jgi:hypothetical protein
MRFASLLVIGSAALFIWACAASDLGGEDARPASVPLGGDDCAVMVAIAKEHYRFGSDNPPPPLKGLGEAGWRPQCDWSRFGLAFADYNDFASSPEPRERLRYVEFQQPRYDGGGALVKTAIMHGPLAGMGYECRVRSGFAGWTVEECRVDWVS